MMKQDKRMTTARSAALLALGLALTGWAEAPPGRYTVSADTVVDTKTTLTWQRNMTATTYNWANAATYCAGLSLAGMTGWRLPSVKELQSLVDIGAYNPAIDVVAFPNLPTLWWWSSSRNPTATTSAFAVNFTNGSTKTYLASVSYPVRCVR